MTIQRQRGEDGSSREDHSGFSLLEPLEPRLMLSGVTEARLSPPDAELVGAVILPLNDAAPVVIPAPGGIINAGVAAQVVNALKQGRHVTVTSDGDLTVASKIFLLDGIPGNQTLTLEARGNVFINDGIRQGKLGRLNLSVKTDGKVEMNGFLNFEGNFSVLIGGEYLQRGHVFIGEHYDIRYGQGGFDGEIGSIIESDVIARRVALSGFGGAIIETSATVTSEGTGSSPGGIIITNFRIGGGGQIQVKGRIIAKNTGPLPFSEEVVSVFLASGYVAVSGTVEGTGRMAASASFFELKNDARIIARIGNISVDTEGMSLSSGSVIEAQSGQVTLSAAIGALGGASIGGTIRSFGGSRSGIDFAGSYGAEFVLQKGGLLVADGGDLKISSPKVRVDGTIVTNGGDVRLQGEMIEVSGKLSTFADSKRPGKIVNGKAVNGKILFEPNPGSGSVPTTVQLSGILLSGGISNERGGDVTIRANGGEIGETRMVIGGFVETINAQGQSIRERGRIQTNGGNVLIEITNNGSLDDNSQVTIDPDNPIVARRVTLDQRLGASLIISGLIDTVYRGNDQDEQALGGGDVAIRIGRASFALTREGQIITGGGDVSIQASGANQLVRRAIHTDNDGDPDGFVDDGVTFFGGVLTLDGVINTLDNLFKVAPPGSLVIPTRDTRLSLGDTAIIRTGNSPFDLSSEAFTPNGQSAGLGGAFVGGNAVTGPTSFTTQQPLRIGLDLSGTDVDITAPLVRVDKDSKLASRQDDVRIDGPILGATLTKKNKRGIPRTGRAVKSGAKSLSSLMLDAAANVFLGGNVTQLKDITIIAKRGVVKVDAGLPTASIVRITGNQTLTIDAKVMHMPNDGISLGMKDRELKMKKPLSLYAAANVTINAGTKPVKLVDVLTAGGIKFTIPSLVFTGGGGLYANDAVNLGKPKVKGREVIVSAPNTPAKVKKVKILYSALQDPIDARLIGTPGAIINVGPRSFEMP
jgi:hypothetical protein